MQREQADSIGVVVGDGAVGKVSAGTSSFLAVPFAKQQFPGVGCNVLMLIDRLVS